MPDFEYEMTVDGRKLKGYIRTEDEQALVDEWTGKGATGIRLIPKRFPVKDYVYRAKDRGGQRVKGVITGVDSFQIPEKIQELEQLGYHDFVIEETFISKLKSFFMLK